MAISTEQFELDLHRKLRNTGLFTYLKSVLDPSTLYLLYVSLCDLQTRTEENMRANYRKEDDKG